MEPISHPNPTAPKPNPEGPFFDTLAWTLIGFFLLVALVICLYSYQGYRLASRQNAANAAMKNERWDAALPNLISLADDPEADRFAAQRDTAICYLGLNKPDEALTWLNKWTAEDKGANATELYGRAYFEKKDYKKAAEYFNQILAKDKNPADPSANFHTGVILFLEGNMAEAGRRFVRATADPKYDKLAEPYRTEMMKRLMAADSATTATTTVK